MTTNKIQSNKLIISKFQFIQNLENVKHYDIIQLYIKFIQTNVIYKTNRI
jgi:hypothetical protein